MFAIKKIHPQAISKALEKVERYRLLNEPIEAESICRDILEIDPDNQAAIIMLVLSLTDQFQKYLSVDEPVKLLSRIQDEFNREYYRGIILERRAKAALFRHTPGSSHDIYEWLTEALEAYEKAEKASPPGNDDAILRWNACVRTIDRFNLSERPAEEPGHMNLSLE
jgi:hypothetical protein